jgi:hypothetical protein
VLCAPYVCMSWVQALATRGHAALRDELLVGFDPLPLLLSSLQGQLLGGRDGGGAQTGAGGADIAPGSTTVEAGNGVVPPVPGLPVLATLWADGLGGRLLGLKWTPAAFLPAPVKVRTWRCKPCMKSCPHRRHHHHVHSAPSKDDTTCSTAWMRANQKSLLIS